MNANATLRQFDETHYTLEVPFFESRELNIVSTITVKVQRFDNLWLVYHKFYGLPFYKKLPVQFIFNTYKEFKQTVEKEYKCNLIRIKK